MEMASGQEERMDMNSGQEEKMNMASGQMEQKKRMIESMCTCERCPSYKDCSVEGGIKELGFCYEKIGKSGCIAEEKGCICAGCPVFTQMQLKNLYYCTKGSEKDQMEKTQSEPESPAQTEAPVGVGSVI